MPPAGNQSPPHPASSTNNDDVRQQRRSKRETILSKQRRYAPRSASAPRDAQGEPGAGPRSLSAPGREMHNEPVAPAAAPLANKPQPRSMLARRHLVNKHRSLSRSRTNRNDADGDDNAVTAAGSATKPETDSASNGGGVAIVQLISSLQDDNGEPENCVFVSDSRTTTVGHDDDARTVVQQINREPESTSVGSGEVAQLHQSLQDETSARRFDKSPTVVLETTTPEQESTAGDAIVVRHNLKEEDKCETGGRVYVPRTQATVSAANDDNDVEALTLVQDTSSKPESGSGDENVVVHHKHSPQEDRDEADNTVTVSSSRGKGSKSDGGDVQAPTADCVTKLELDRTDGGGETNFDPDSTDIGGDVFVQHNKDKATDNYYVSFSLAASTTNDDNDDAATAVTKHEQDSSDGGGEIFMQLNKSLQDNNDAPTAGIVHEQDNIDGGREVFMQLNQGLHEHRFEPQNRVYEFTDGQVNVSSMSWLADAAYRDNTDQDTSLSIGSIRSVEDPGDDAPVIPVRRRGEEEEEKKEKETEQETSAFLLPISPLIGAPHIDPLDWTRLQDQQQYHDNAASKSHKLVECTGDVERGEGDNSEYLLGGQRSHVDGDRQKDHIQHDSLIFQSEEECPSVGSIWRSTKQEEGQEGNTPKTMQTSFGKPATSGDVVLEKAAKVSLQSMSREESSPGPLNQHLSRSDDKQPSSGRPPRGTSNSPIPPPPPPGSKKKKKKKRRNKATSTATLQINPTREEKPLKNSGKPSVTVDALAASESDVPSPQRASSVGSLLEMESSSGRSFSHQGGLPRKFTFSEDTRCASDGDFFQTKPSPEQASESPKKTLKTSSADMSRSPVSSSAVIHDIKMAEKVDWAISAASSKFEEQVSQVPSRDRSTSSANDLSCGAFQSWSLTGSLVSENISAVASVARNAFNLNGSSGIDETKHTTTAGHESPFGRRSIFPADHPSPFEATVNKDPQVISLILDFLGDPVAVCRTLMLNKACNKYVEENEYILMRDAVRIGGISRNVRPYFWLWVTLDKCSNDLDATFDSDLSSMTEEGFCQLQRQGKAGKWSSIIERDVSRSFGNLPPHKMGARLRTDSIVRALVSWGRCRIMKRGVKGEAEAPNGKTSSSDLDEVSLTPTDTVSDWGGVDPVGSVTSNEAEEMEWSSRRKESKVGSRQPDGELALSGNSLPDDVKRSLQEKLSFILHALASSHDDVGYCQGMDYVVAHLLRILPDTIRWQGVKGTLPGVIHSARGAAQNAPRTAGAFAQRYSEVDRSLIVEETCYRVMDVFFTTYNLRHFYYPELRCLKTCCRVFEKLIHLKLPVLADHFEHHELNVGLFALGWFQTLFLYLPSMPSATVCHMWDIWLVERSYKIFFRVGTAILFLSQPILLNHELEGMMNYLNTFPDATLLSLDILIPCALQIKVTNKILMELEREVATSMT